MMTTIKRYLLLSLFALCGVAATAQVTLDEARQLYSGSMKDKLTCESAYKKFTPVKEAGNPLLTGYKGAVSVAMSKHLKTAKEKIACFNDGKRLIETAILEDGKSVELKFLRFTIQCNCPPALKYNKNITEDKKYIIENLGSVKNAGVRNKIKEYLLQSKDVTAEEKQKLNDL